MADDRPALEAALDEAVATGRLAALEVEALSRQAEDLRLENERLLEAMLVDSHTGLPNTAVFEADHTQLWARFRRKDDPYAVLLANIDHFPGFNDLYGEDAGHDAMTRVAVTIGGTMRQTDRTYRIGGEDVAVLLPGADVREALVAAERVRIKVEDMGIEHTGNAAGVVTVTIAAISAGFRHETTKDVMTELQDLLASGRDLGRNLVIWPH